MTLAEAVRDAMAILFVLKNPPADMANASRVWLRVMSRNHVTAEELQAAVDWWAENEAWFPAPAEVLGAIKRARESRKALEHEIGMKSLKVGCDENGSWWAAPPDLVDGDRYIGELPSLGWAPGLPCGEIAIVSRSDLEDAFEAVARKMAMTRRLHGSDDEAGV